MAPISIPHIRLHAHRALLILLLGLAVGCAALMGPQAMAHQKQTPPQPSEYQNYSVIEEPLNGLELLEFFFHNNLQKNNENLLLPPDLILEYRLAELNRKSVIPIAYHPLVRKYIHTYAIARKEQVAQLLGLAELYFPLFEAALDRYHLPLELVYLAVVESALNPLAVSKSGAVGLWQFKINTGKMFGLRVDNYIDDRMDPVRATEAACVYLQYLYRLFDDWPLALTAYNAGPGTLQRAILRAGGEKNFWKLLNYLPEDAQNYFPAFIAAYYIFTYHEPHGIPSLPPSISFSQVDTIAIHKPLAFDAIARWTNLPIQTLHFLNPRYRHGYIPQPTDENEWIVLPKQAQNAFIENQPRIEAQSYKPVDVPYPDNNGDKQIRIEHRVKKGEYLHKIAIMYGCTVNDLQRWNGQCNDIYPGQRLEIWVPTNNYKQLKNLIEPSAGPENNQTP